MDLFGVKAHFALEILTGSSDECDYVFLPARIFFNGLEKANQLNYFTSWHGELAVTVMTRFENMVCRETVSRAFIFFLKKENFFMAVIG